MLTRNQLHLCNLVANEKSRLGRRSSFQTSLNPQNCLKNGAKRHEHWTKTLVKFKKDTETILTTKQHHKYIVEPKTIRLNPDPQTYGPSGMSIDIIIAQCSCEACAQASTRAESRAPQFFPRYPFLFASHTIERRERIVVSIPTSSFP